MFNPNGRKGAQLKTAQQPVPVALRMLGSLVVFARSGFAAVINAQRQAVRTGGEPAELYLMWSAKDGIITDQVLIDKDATRLGSFDQQQNRTVGPFRGNFEFALIPNRTFNPAHHREPVGAMVRIELTQAGGLGGSRQFDFARELLNGRWCITAPRAVEAYAPFAGEGEGISHQVGIQGRRIDGGTGKTGMAFG